MDSKFTVNFYEVLGVEPTASFVEIKKQYSKLVAKYHPDKAKDNFEASLFELIQRAYETIGKEDKRKEYDFFIKNIEQAKNNDFIGLKTNYKKYRDLEDTQQKDKDTAQLEFNKVFSDFDTRHNIDRSTEKEKITEEEINSRLDNLLLQREQEEIEFSQNAIFQEGEDFNISKFNAAFDLYKNTNDKQIQKHSEVAPFNFDNGLNGLDSYDKIYNDDNQYDGNNMFSSVNFGRVNNLNSEHIKNINPVNYTVNHNLKESNYEEELKRRLAERNLETQQIDTMKFSEFNTEDKSFQFLHDVGITENMIDWKDNSEDLLKACKKLIELEKKTK